MSQNLSFYKTMNPLFGISTRKNNKGNSTRANTMNPLFGISTRKNNKGNRTRANNNTNSNNGTRANNTSTSANNRNNNSNNNRRTIKFASSNNVRSIESNNPKNMKNSFFGRIFGRRSMKGKRYFGQNARPRSHRITPLNPRDPLNRNLMKYNPNNFTRRRRILNKLKDGKYYLNENNVRQLNSTNPTSA